MAKPKRITKILLALAIVVAVAGVWFWRSVVLVHGFLTAVSPVDATHAVVCMQANHEYGYGARGWVGLLDSDGHYVWSQRLPGLPISGAQHEGMLVEDGIAFVRTTDLGRSTGHTTAYRVADGAELWSATAERPNAAFGVDLVGNGTGIVQGFEVEGTTKVVSLAKADGKVEWETTLGAMLTVQRLGDRLVALGPDLGEARPTGPITVLDAPGCNDKGELVTIARPDLSRTASRVVARTFDGGAERIIAPSLTMPEGMSLGRTFACGTHHGHFVFTVALEASAGHRTSTLGIVETASDGGDSKVTVIPGADILTTLVGPNTDVAKASPEGDPLRGELPRFVPFVFLDDQQYPYVSTLDLEEHRVVRRGPPVPGAHLLVFRQGDDFLVANQPAGGAVVLARFDGASGKIVKAISMPGARPWKPHHASDGRLWLYDNKWVSPTPFVVLDASSLSKVGGPASVTDALAEAKRWLPD